MSCATVNVAVSIDAEEIQKDNLCDNVLKLLKRVRPAWFKGDGCPPDLRAKVFTGGISNQLYGYYIDGKFKEDVVLVRIYGNGTELMIDRELEKKNIQVLSAAGRCPPLYGTFNNGIAYGFVNGETLDEQTVRQEPVTKLIAKEMIVMHKIRPEGREVKCEFWDKIYKFLELGPDSFQDPERQKQYIANVKPKEVLRTELDALKAHIEVLKSPIVFTHNDLLLKNIIYNKEKDCVHFIDHEYAMFNYEHFELGNHFAEYAGVDELDFTRYPDKAYQLVWLRYYLEQQAIDEGRSPDTVTDTDVEVCYVKTNKFTLVAHLFWGLWGLVQAKYSLIDFGFLDYATQKLNEYFARKEEFLALKLPS